MIITTQDRRQTSNNLDWITILLYAVLMAVGWIAVFASSYDSSSKAFFHTHHIYIRQLIWIGISVVLALFIVVIDNKFYTAFAYFIYGAVMLLLVAVFFFGHEVKGNKNWFEIGSFQIQPSEFAKFAVNLALAKFLSNPNQNMKTLRTRLLALAIIFVPAAMIQLQGDTGSTLVFLCFLLVLYRFGLPGEFLLLGIFILALSIFALLINKITLIVTLIVVASFVIYIVRRTRKNILLIGALLIISVAYVFVTDYAFNKILKPHQQQRIQVMLGMNVNVKDADYNVRQSKIAIGSGGFLGKGPLQGTLTKYNFVPEQHTDFIFCTIGEEYGFLGSTVLILIYLGLLLRILMIAERQRSVFSRTYAYGVASIIFFHVMINIGMTVGLAPVIGIPLPFISYGGSSLLSFTILLFILIKLDADRLSVLR